MPNNPYADIVAAAAAPAQSNGNSYANRAKGVTPRLQRLPLRRRHEPKHALYRHDQQSVVDLAISSRSVQQSNRRHFLRLSRSCTISQRAF
jgi:hypothetical protein